MVCLRQLSEEVLMHFLGYFTRVQRPDGTNLLVDMLRVDEDRDRDKE